MKNKQEDPPREDRRKRIIRWKVRECARREQKLLYPLDRVSARSEQKRMAVMTGLDVCVFFVCEGGIKKQ